MSQFTVLKRVWLILSLAALLQSTIASAAVTPEAAAEVEHELYAARYKRAAELYASLIKQDADWAPGYNGIVRALIADDRSREAYKAADDGLRRCQMHPRRSLPPDSLPSVVVM